MKIAIVGVGNIGAGLGRAWSHKGHQVVFGVRDPNDTKAISAATGAGGSARTIAEAIDGSEVVALALPFGAVEEVLRAAGSIPGRIIIDCTNPGGAIFPAGVTSPAEFVATLAPEARVVKSFNAQGAENLSVPRYGSETASNFYCGDDSAAKGVVRQLASDVGFDPIDAGPLKNARLLEAATVLWLAASRSLGTRRVAFRMVRKS